MAVSGNNVYVSWTEHYFCAVELEPTCESQVMFVKSDDCGDTFGKPVSLQELTGETFSMPVLLRMAADDSYAYILWIEGNSFDGEDYNYYFSASDDKGNMFSAKVALLDKDDDDEFTHISDFTAIGDTMYALKRSNNNAVVIKSTDHESPIVADMAVPEEFFEGAAQFAIGDDSHAYFLLPVYSEKGARISVASVNEGSKVNTVEILKRDYVSETPMPSDALMTISKDTVHVVWIESSGAESDYRQQMFVRTSTDSGKSFSDSVQAASMVTVPEFGSVAVVSAAVAAGIGMVAARLRNHRWALSV